MKMVTNQFGEIEYSEDALIYFPRGTIGFEDCRQFILIDNEKYKPFHGLMSVNERKIGFPVLNPFMVDSEFGKKLPGNLLNQLFSSDKPVDIFCIVNLNGEGGKATINLKSPIIIDYQLKQGEQIILDSDDLPVDRPLS